MLVPGPEEQERAMILPQLAEGRSPQRGEQLVGEGPCEAPAE